LFKQERFLLITDGDEDIMGMPS